MQEARSGTLIKSSAGKPLPNRACVECKRKKTRCDKKQPECSLCVRVGDSCTYPERRPTFKSRKLHRPPKLWSLLEHEEETLALAGTAVSDYPCPPTLVSRPESFQRAETECHVGLTSSSPTVDYMTDLVTNQDFLNWPELFPASPLAAAGRQDNEECSIETNLSFTLPDLPPGNPDLPPREKVQPSNRLCYTLTVSPQVATELINLFFTKIQCFLPLIHQKRFTAKYGYIARLTGQHVCNLSSESFIMLNAMFSLAARFSTAPIFSTENPLHRGDCFLAQAMATFDTSYGADEECLSTLPYLQGLVILTFSALQAGPSRRGWLLSGVCIRLAYELDLHNTDVDILSGDTDLSKLDLEEWQSREERRRAWWIIWDLDTFASTMWSRPFSIDGHAGNVFLPLSDDQWLEGERVASAPLDSNPSRTWNSLCDSPNQNEWAWFLVCLAVHRQVLQAISLPATRVRVQALQDANAYLGCFALALPEKFQVNSGSMIFDETHFVASNWVVCVSLLLYFSRSLLAVHTGETFTTRMELGYRTTAQHQRYQTCDPFRHEIASCARAWSPKYLAQSTPLIAGCIVGPAFSHVLGEGPRKPGEFKSIHVEILKMTLKRFARHWIMGKTLSDTLEALEKAEDSGPLHLETADSLCWSQWPTIMPWKPAKRRDDK